MLYESGDLQSCSGTSVPGDPVHFVSKTWDNHTRTVVQAWTRLLHQQHLAIRSRAQTWAVYPLPLNAAIMFDMFKPLPVSNDTEMANQMAIQKQ